MIRHWSCIVVAMLCALIFATSASADCSWVMWQQDTVFTERWWIPNGWPFGKTTIESVPEARSEFQTLDQCHTALWRTVAADMQVTSEQMKSGRPIRSLSRYACVAFGQRPLVIEPGGGVWR